MLLFGAKKKDRNNTDIYKNCFESTFDMYFINYLISCENNGLNVY